MLMLTETHYRQLLELSQRMLDAGMAQHWDELVSLEQQRRALLEKAPAMNQADSPLPLIELIHQIQACDQPNCERNLMPG